MIAPDTVTSLPEALASRYALDVEALVAQLFAPVPETPVDPEATTGSTVAGSTGPLGAVPPTSVVEDEEGGDGIDFSLGEAPATDGFQPKFGIWLVWLLGIVGSAGLALVVDEKRRHSRER
ncbi:MAG: hypothetical protein ACRDZM_12060 [Acidimicrobiia bacterium]